MIRPDDAPEPSVMVRVHKSEVSDLLRAWSLVQQESKRAPRVDPYGGMTSADWQRVGLTLDRLAEDAGNAFSEVQP